MLTIIDEFAENKKNSSEVREEKCTCHLKPFETCRTCLDTALLPPQPEESWEDTWEGKFDLMWGLAPESSLKGKKGKEVKEFIQNLLIEMHNHGYDQGYSKGKAETIERVKSNLKCIPEIHRNN